MSKIQAYIDQLNRGEQLTKIDLKNQDFRADAGHQLKNFLELLAARMASVKEIISIDLEGAKGIAALLPTLFTNLAKLKKVHLGLANCDLENSHFQTCKKSIKNLELLGIYNNPGITEAVIEVLLAKKITLTIDALQITDATHREKLKTKYSKRLVFMPTSPDSSEGLSAYRKIKGKDFEKQFKPEKNSTDEQEATKRIDRRRSASSSAAPDSRPVDIFALIGHYLPPTNGYGQLIETKKRGSSKSFNGTPTTPKHDKTSTTRVLATITEESNISVHNHPSSSRDTNTPPLLTEPLPPIDIHGNLISASAPNAGSSESQQTNTPHSPATPSSKLQAKYTEPDNLDAGSESENEDAGSSDGSDRSRVIILGVPPAPQSP